MKYLVLAYGAAQDWNRLTPKEQESLLAQDQVLRDRGSLVAALEPSVVTVRAWDGTPTVTRGPVGHLDTPLAGFGIIEAEDVDHAIQLVANTPCARANGAVEIRLITQINQGPSVVG